VFVLLITHPDSHCIAVGKITKEQDYADSKGYSFEEMAET
jgi:hypothetical protein